ncbi:MerR family transcriptional regulator [Vibrio fluvialis]|nr:MerR family transcriptional regulator [Vibrio fluvialis]
MNIKAFSELTGLSTYTLRYYEKIGLLKNVQRTPSGRRVYTSKEVDWVRFIVRLKETGMPLGNILQYAELRACGTVSHSERQQLLEEHRKQLKAHLDTQLSHLQALDRKIEWYKAQEIH